jgi:hypothetical protein
LHQDIINLSAVFIHQVVIDNRPPGETIELGRVCNITLGDRLSITAMLLLMLLLLLLLLLLLHS